MSKKSHSKSVKSSEKAAKNSKDKSFSQVSELEKQKDGALSIKDQFEGPPVI